MRVFLLSAEWACVWGVGGCEVVGGNEVVHVKAKKKNMV